jgi:hypothetical protein
LRIFNFNNRILMTHDLLDDYTSAYTTSETPFFAWVTVVARRYESQQSEHRFLSEAMFRATWFAYIGLQYLSGDMECPLCGPSPDTTIWDGVTLAFNQKHLLPSLQPPTSIFKDAPIRKHVRYVYKQQLLPDKVLRRLVRGIISGPSLLLASDSLTVNSDRRQTLETGNHSDTDSDGDDEMGHTITATSNAKKQILARIEGIPVACEKLTAIDAGLGELFSEQFGLRALVGKRWGSPVYERFFVQVRPGTRVPYRDLLPLGNRLLLRSPSSRW